MSTSQSAWMLCGRGVKADGSFHLWTNAWVAGTTVCDPSLTRAIPERLRHEQLIIKRYTNKAYLHTFYLPEIANVSYPSDLDYVDDVALLAQMLEVLLLSLSVTNEEAKPLGLHINWSKTKIQQIDEPRHSHTHLTVTG